MLCALRDMPGFSWKEKLVQPLIHGEHVALLLFLEELHGLWRKESVSCARPDAYGYEQVSMGRGMHTPAQGAAPVDGVNEGAVPAIHEDIHHELESPQRCRSPSSYPAARTNTMHAHFESASMPGGLHVGIRLKRSAQGPVATIATSLHIARRSKPHTHRRQPAGGMIRSAEQASPQPTGPPSRLHSRADTYGDMACATGRRKSGSRETKGRPKLPVNLQALHAWLAQHGIVVCRDCHPQTGKTVPAQKLGSGSYIFAY